MCWCFKTRSLRRRQLFNYDLQQWHWAKCFVRFVFYICLSVCRFAEGNICRKCALFCLIDINKRSFLTSCVFWFVFLNASCHLCFRKKNHIKKRSFLTSCVFWIGIVIRHLVHYRRRIVCRFVYDTDTCTRTPHTFKNVLFFLTRASWGICMPATFPFVIRGRREAGSSSNAIFTTQTPVGSNACID